MVYLYKTIKKSVIESAHGQIDVSSRHPARLIGGHEDRHICQLLQHHDPLRVARICNVLLELLPGHSVWLGFYIEDLSKRVCLRYGIRPQADHTDTVGREFNGEVTGKRFLGSLRRTIAPGPRITLARGKRGDSHDHP